MSALSVHLGPAPQPRRYERPRGEERRQFEALPPGGWVRFENATTKDMNRIGRTAARAGCVAYWDEKGNLIAKKKGRAK